MTFIAKCFLYNYDVHSQMFPICQKDAIGRPAQSDSDRVHAQKKPGF